MLVGLLGLRGEVEHRLGSTGSCELDGGGVDGQTHDGSFWRRTIRLPLEEPLNLPISDRISRKTSSGWHQPLRFPEFWIIVSVIPQGAGAPSGHGEAYRPRQIREGVVKLFYSSDQGRGPDE